MSKYFTILTSVGEAKLANATALGETVKFTELALGDGNGSLPTPTQSQTSLINEVRRKTLNSVSVDEDNPNWVMCEQVIPEDVGGWTIREVGIYDADGDLIAVGNFPETYKPILEEGSGRTQTIRVVLQISSTSTVELKIDPSVVLATREYVDKQDKAHENKSNPHPQYAKETDLNTTISALQFAEYNPNRKYSVGETCWTRKNGDFKIWQWYSNVESLAGKNPLDESNRHIGWTVTDKPFYWIEYKADIVGMPFYWLDTQAPEWAVMEINVDLPSFVYWRLAKRYPSLVFNRAGVSYINTGEIRAEFLRVLDQGRGIDVNRQINTAQRASIMASNDDNDAANTCLQNVNVLREEFGWETVDISHIDNNVQIINWADGQGNTKGSVGGLDLTKWMGASRSRNVARPMAIAI